MISFICQGWHPLLSELAKKTLEYAILIFKYWSWQVQFSKLSKGCKTLCFPSTIYLTTVGLLKNESALLPMSVIRITDCSFESYQQNEGRFSKYLKKDEDIKFLVNCPNWKPNWQFRYTQNLDSAIFPINY